MSVRTYLTENGESGKPKHDDNNRSRRHQAHQLLDRLIDEVQHEGFTGNVSLELHGKDGKILRLIDNRTRHHRDL